MNPGDTVSILLAHDRWANRSVLRACEGSSTEQLHRRFEMGPGSLHDTAAHIARAMRVWTDVLAGRPVRPWLDEASRRTASEPFALLEEAGAALAAHALAGPLTEELERERRGTVESFTRAEVIAHVATHGMHHRAQMLNMLRHVGVSPLPLSSVTEWSREGRPA